MNLCAFRIWLLVAPLFLIAAGCAVGPDFVRPDPPEVKTYTYKEDREQTIEADGKAQRFETGARLAEDWWQLFNSPELDAMVKAAIEENWNLKAALARLRAESAEP